MRSRFLLFLLFTSFHCFAIQKVDIYTYEIPKLAFQQDGKVIGPIIETMSLYYRSVGIEPNYIALPEKRAKLLVRKNKNACIMPLVGNVNTYEEVDYKVPLGAVPVHVYALEPKKISLEELKGEYTIIGPGRENTPNINQLQTRKLQAQDNATVFDMLIAKRGEYAVLPEVTAGYLMAINKTKIYPVYTVTTGHAWFACNKENALPDSKSFYKTFRQFITSDLSLERYRKYKMESFHLYFHGTNASKWDQITASIELENNFP